MREAAEVILWGTRIGVVALRDGDRFAEFVYDGAFLDLGIEPSPIVMPIGTACYRFPQLPEASFHGLPGMLADSCPDKFGNQVLDVWLQSQGRTIESLSAIERLSYTGSRGMGALEYRPVLMEGGDADERIKVEELAELAERILTDRGRARAELAEGMPRYSAILKVGTSAGGARAKALIGWNEKTGEVRSGQVKLGKDFGYWLIKFDGLEENGDKDGGDAAGYGKIEYAYYLMAKAAGIEMSECRLWDGRHFMTRRFDRTAEGDKLHMQTLGALAHLDYNDPEANSYEQAFRVARRVVHSVKADEQLFRRMVFNVLACNCDDHVKNVSFLMDRNGEWSLAPAYDVTFAFRPDSIWTSGHQMGVNGKRRGITTGDLMATAKTAGINAPRATSIIEEVESTVARWPEFAEVAGVPHSVAEAYKF